MNTPDTEWSSVKEQVYNLVKEVHIQKPFEDVTGEPHYVTDQIMKLISSRDTYWKERVKDLEQDFIIFKRPECNVKDFLAQSGDGQLHRLMEINPKEALDTLLDNLK